MKIKGTNFTKANGLTIFTKVNGVSNVVNTLSVAELRIQPSTAGGPIQQDATLVVAQVPCVLYFSVFGGAGAGTTTQAKLQVNGSNLYTSGTATQYQTLKESYTFTSPGTYSISLYGTFVGSSGNNATCRISGAY